MVCVTPSTAVEVKIYYYGDDTETFNSGDLARVSEAPHLLKKLQISGDWAVWNNTLSMSWKQAGLCSERPGWFIRITAHDICCFNCYL